MELNSNQDVVTKGRFAELIGVSAGRVTQMISEGKISGEAMVGEGRNAKIRVDVARQQIRERTDLGQALGNGFETRVREEAPAPAAPAAPTAPVSPRTNSFDDQFRQQKLEQIQRQNRREAEADLARRGTYVRADETKAAMTKMAVQLLTVFEGSLVDLATAIAGKFSLSQRDVVHLLRTEFREVRAKASAKLKEQAMTMPEIVEDNVADASDEAVGEA